MKNMRVHAIAAAAVALLLAAHTGAYAQLNYGVIPKLEEMKDRPAAPDFSLVNPAGKKVSLQDFRGKVVFLNFWASWCGPCRGEMPGMGKLYREFKGKGFEIVAVNVKDKRDDALKFMKDLKISYPVALDPEGEIGLLYGAWAMPSTYLIDRKGIVLARMWGPADWYSDDARKLIRTLVEQK
ncbi:MAG TPA: TlpA disulfide reductase family protein [Burkholderiales bacterium]|nr:TlpA disulfide reductase family protein [Burkholderiales bacterium]